MTTSLQILMNEHKNILKVINGLIKECELLNSGVAEIDKDFFINAVDFIKGYADSFHHAKEEDILFVELVKKEVQMRCDPTKQMLYEHELGRNFIKALEEGIKEGDKIKIIENARGYAELLNEHIYKEDNILFPMAEEALSSELKEKILAKFKEVEQKFNKRIEKHIKFCKNLKIHEKNSFY